MFKLCIFSVFAFILLVAGFCAFTVKADDLAMYKSFDKAQVEAFRAETNYLVKAQVKERSPVITSKDIYWLTRLDPIRDSCGFYCFIAIFLILGCSVAWSYGKNENEHVPLWLGGIGTVFFSLLLMFSIIVQIFVPTTKEMAMIKITPAIVNSDFVQEDLPKETKELYSMAKQYLQEKVKK